MFKLFKSSYNKVKGALLKTRSLLASKIASLFSKGKIDESTLEEFERILFEADLGSELATHFVDFVKEFAKKHPSASSKELLTAMQEHSLEILQRPPKVQGKTTNPKVFLIVGINGSGKTTTIAKLAHHHKEQKEKVLLGAGDTFRAAAIEQLSMWANRVGVDIVKASPGSDPAAVAYDTLSAAVARDADTVFFDTAGRLENKTDLMQELEKVKRSMGKIVSDAPAETYLVLDATVGGNALHQVEIFNSFTPLTGIVLTKLDGTAKGGIILSIYKKFGIPIKWIGVGEKMDDLIPFDPEEYTKALFTA